MKMLCKFVFILAGLLCLAGCDMGLTEEELIEQQAEEEENKKKEYTENAIKFLNEWTDEITLVNENDPTNTLVLKRNPDVEKRCTLENNQWEEITYSIYENEELKSSGVFKITFVLIDDTLTIIYGKDGSLSSFVCENIITFRINEIRYLKFLEF